MKKRNQGFTFIEMIMTLSIVLLVVAFLPSLLDIHWLKSERGSSQRLEWQLFVQQLKNEVRESRQLECNGTTLILYKQAGEQVSFEKYGQSLRRRVNGRGNEIVLQSISNVQYEATNNGVRVAMTTTEGKRYEAFVTTFFPIQVKEQ
ncbi:competence type IV pilus minor pilin ComGF [Thermaerobacillus caldiproteolyticus]|uniref:competence type IV pilus minor pilin ComGF n=1 Tax=Thermaerobacillus caldiproteolyticus TaxID=247480 RepID=UPI0018F1565B|nr:competence type IV pilus minor pilin ComGF [Anoxybacillus caldiproteolyticus]